VEIVMNLSRSEQYLTPLQNRYFIGSPFFRPRTVRQPGAGTLLSTLKALADVKARNGTLHVTALDLTRRQTPFHQNAVEQLDWPRLVEAVKNANEPVISADALSGSQYNSAYFREALQQRLAPAFPTGVEPPPAAVPCGASTGAQEPVRVLIVLSEAVVFQRGADLRPLPVSASANCRVFYLRYMAASVASFDDLDRIIKPLKPQRFDIETPMELRRALRKILDEIGKL
jgi:hypothetical protein